MRPDDIQSFLEADPFVTFYLNLSDGSCFEVSDPAQVSFTPSGTLVHDAKGRRTYIALAPVASVGFAPSSRSANLGRRVVVGRSRTTAATRSTRAGGFRAAAACSARRTGFARGCPTC